MPSLTNIFLKGLMALLPAAVTVSLILWLATSSENWIGGIVKPYLQEWYVPGMGLVLTIIAVFAVGILMHAYLIRRLVRLGEAILHRIPLVKTIYSSVQDLMEFFARARNKDLQQVVMVDVELGGLEARMMGFVTRDDFSQLPDGIGGPGKVCVYLPMSYQIGGYTLILDRERVHPVELSMEAAMRFAITAGMTTSGMDAKTAVDK